MLLSLIGRASTALEVTVVVHMLFDSFRYLRHGEDMFFLHQTEGVAYGQATVRQFQGDQGPNSDGRRARGPRSDGPLQEGRRGLMGVCPLPAHEHGPMPNPEQFK